MMINAPMPECPKCGADQIDRGKITSAGAVAYKTDRQSHPFVAANVMTYVCLSCGYTESYVDPKYLAKVKGMSG